MAAPFDAHHDNCQESTFMTDDFVLLLALKTLSWLVFSHTSCNLHPVLSLLVQTDFSVRESPYWYPTRLPTIDELAVIHQIRVAGASFI